jgi:hypothetical protein
MPRPFIEFIQSQPIPWSFPDWTFRTGVSVKTLSLDDETGAMSCLIHYPPGWTGPGGAIGADEEFFVLQGALASGERSYLPHHYAYLPAGYRRGAMSSPDGAVVLTFFSADPESPVVAPGDETGLVEQLDPLKLPWDRTNMDPNIDHLNAWRKNLRLGPNDSGRSYLLAGLPQGYPSSGSESLERHPHVEEMFMIDGDMPCSLGVMRAGAYFWRPPQIWHGADCTRNGFLIFARTPGTNRTISEWSSEKHPVTFHPPFRPVLPPALQPFAGYENPDLTVY